MIPYIYTAWGDIYTFTIAAIVGVLLMLIMIHYSIKDSVNADLEFEYIVPKIFVSGVVGCICAAVADSLFKIRENGAFVLKGITFYGGLIGGCILLFVLLKITCRNTQFAPMQWFEMLTCPFIVFHICGRIGCFLAGCCYGKPTDSFLGVKFPDIEAEGVFHHGKNCFPTQLFEVVALTVILIVVLRQSKKFEKYLLMYAVARFIIEFFRGDYRGNLFALMSPAQIISIVIIICIGAHAVFKRNRKQV